MKDINSNDNPDSPLTANEFLRPFAAGSRQAPDPYDQYLDEHGFYRKHTARNSSSLFRVVSEQIYGVQRYHERVRSECVTFMEQNCDKFLDDFTKKNDSRNFDDYLMDMAKVKTSGSVLELKAMGMRYEANVLIFEPFTDGKWLDEPKTAHKKTIRVFHAPNLPTHFDTVFTKEYIVKAAFCQAVVYEILYKKVFLLPDVDYAVEHMLNDPFEVRTSYSIDELGEKVVVDGRELRFDSAHDTECILEDFRFCHFHNKDGYHQEFEAYQAAKGNSDNIKGKFNTDIFLHDPNISCVRQLIKEGITPFPYKIAKALEPSIYRNIEYDLWADNRREYNERRLKLNGVQFKIGTKCFLRKINSNGYYSICTIQAVCDDKTNYEVLLEATGEILTASFKQLVPITNDRGTYRHTLIKPSELRKVLKKQAYYQDFIRHKNDWFDYLQKPSRKFNAPFTPQEYIVMPLMVNNNESSGADTSGATNDGNQNINDLNENVNDEQRTFTTESGYNSLNITGQSAVLAEAGPNNPQVGYFYVPYYPQYPNPAMQPQMMPFAQYPNQPYWPYQTLPTAPPQINYNALYSDKIDGSDLPWNDLPTLRFFYNAGVEYFRVRENIAPTPVQPRESDVTAQQATSTTTQSNDNNEMAPTQNVSTTTSRPYRGRGRGGYHHQSDRGRGGHSNQNRRFGSSNQNSSNFQRQNNYGRDRQQTTPDVSGGGNGNGNQKPPAFQRNVSIKKENATSSEPGDSESGIVSQATPSHSVQTLLTPYNRTPVAIPDDAQSIQASPQPINFSQPPPPLDYGSYVMPPVPVQIGSGEATNLGQMVDSSIIRQNPMPFQWGVNTVNAPPMQNFMFYSPQYQQPNAFYNPGYLPNYYNQPQ